MKFYFAAVLSIASIGACISSNAQTSSAIPAGSTGLCNDGTYSQNAKKSGACSGHKGVKTWYVTASTNVATKPMTATTASGNQGNSVGTSNVPDTKLPTTSSRSNAGPGMVWVNTATKVYHCSGTRFYGTTKKGAYMSEADAKTKGFHPDANKTCSK
ncbi:MAG: DUF3761 domain-containing protein [Acidobacteriaceae bacterium]|nr:DUF3761 domain-containing protein [Acidobacteriaceae bacterium]